MISDLFNTIFINNSYTISTTFFFLQAKFPIVEIGQSKITFTAKFLLLSKNENRQALVNDSLSINEIISFIGQDPYDSPMVKEIFRNREEFTNDKLKKIQDLSAEYRNRQTFIEEFIVLPWRCDKLVGNLVPYKINYLKFNNELNEVEVDYSFSSGGATDIYRLNGGVWLKYKTLIEWTD